MRAVVTAEFAPDGEARLAALGYTVTRAGWGATGQELGPAELAAACAGAELLITEIEPVTAELLAACPELRAVGCARGAPTNVDLDACRARGIPVLHAPGRNADSVADFTVGLLLSAARSISAAERHLRTTGWLVDGQLPYRRFRGPELAGRTVGIVGYGAVGQRVASRLFAGFGMTTLFTDPYRPGGVPLPDLLAASDVLTLHCPRGPQTRGLIGAAELDRMPPGGYLINTAGGDQVDEDALVAALRSGRLAGAALDVFRREPLAADSVLWQAPNLVLTPHLAGAADDVVAHHTDLLCEDLERLARGEPALHRAG